MENNEEQAVDLENNDSEGQVVLPEEPTDTPQVSEREKELESEVAKWKRIANKNKEKKVEAPTKKSEDKPEDLGYGEKAFLRSYDIKGADELTLVKNWVERTGDSLDSLVEDEIFQAKLSGLREARASVNAIPKGTKRSAQPQTDDFQVAYAKYKESGTLPDDRGLREKVLDARISEEKGENAFASQGIIMGNQ